MSQGLRSHKFSVLLLMLTCSIAAVALSAAPATWSLTTGDMLVARYAHTATALLDGRLLVAGGSRLPGDVVTDLTDIYDSTLGTWSATGRMGVARDRHTATLLADGRVLVAGGFNDTLRFLASAEIYDPALGTWSSAGSMASARMDHAAARLLDGRVLVLGGRSSYGGPPIDTAEIYDPATGMWSSTPPMTGGRYYHTATLLIDGRVLASGGNATSTAEIYDPALGTWSPTGSMNVVRDTHTATRLPDGRVLVTGGFDPLSQTSAELFDPVTGSWTQTGALNQGRGIHRAAKLSDGRVLVTGGYNLSAFDALTSAEIYDPSAGAWSITTPMHIGRSWHTATALPDGHVIVTGGISTTLPFLTAEVYSDSTDQAGPTITIASPAANATYQLNASLIASYTCTDSESGVASCDGSLANNALVDTSSTGMKTFTVRATDNAGNSSTETVTYDVVSGGGGGQFSADVGISLNAPAKVSPDGTLIFSIGVSNGGRLTATGVVVSDALPAGTVFSSASSSQGTVNAPAVGSNGTLTVNLGNLANGAAASIDVVVTLTAASGTVLGNVATVGATTQDLNSSNNFAFQKTTVSKK